MLKQNKVVRIALHGGLVGIFLNNPRKVLQDTIDFENTSGWNVHQIMRHRSTNLLILILQAIVFICTIGIWTWDAGYLILFERVPEMTKESISLSIKNDSKNDERRYMPPGMR